MATREGTFSHPTGNPLKPNFLTRRAVYKNMAEQSEEAQRLAHSAFLRRNSHMLAATAAASMPSIRRNNEELLEKLALLVALGRPAEVADGRRAKPVRQILRANDATMLATWDERTWRRKLVQTNDGREAAGRLHRLFQVLRKRRDFPHCGSLRLRSYPSWRRLMAQIGCPPELAGSITSILLDRHELPGGPYVRPFYARIGFSFNGEGRPTWRAIQPEALPEMKWRIIQLATRICQTHVEPGTKDCAPCPVKAFCAAFRKARGADPEANPTSLIDLFAGGGGLSLGLTQAGMRLKLAVEMDQWAADTIYLNHPEAPRGVVSLHDVTKLASDADELAKYRHVDVVAGGPPCQPFSMARRHSGADRIDTRRYLFRAFLEVASKVEPRVLIMENVPGILNAAGGRILKALENEFAEAGFLLGHKLLSASSYGVPQNRSRVFFIGVHKKRNAGPARLLQAILTLLDNGKHHGPIVTSAQALNGVPRKPANGGGLVVRRTSRGRRTRYARTLQRPERVLYNHETRPHNPRDIQIFDELGWGETARELEARKPKTIPYQLESFGDKYRRIHPNRPAPTIPAHLRRDANSFVHPFVPRGITPREAARFQSFPDDYVFLGGLGPSFVQIGNAVPPLLAKAVGSAVVRALRESGPAT